MATNIVDFLDNLRTKNLCGDEASGSDNSGYWRLPEVDNNTVTTLKAGDTLNATWNLHYAHQGGWNFELYDADAKQVAVWNDSSHYGCTHDGTQQWVELSLPNITCTNCTLRLVRQALEWGGTYLFRSCSLVNIEQSDNENATCNGCSGHGRCEQGKCVCDKNRNAGFWEGTYCERQNECDTDAHCGEGGMCIDVGATSPPRKQCYCKEGWFGEEVMPWAPDSMLPTRICNRQSNLTLGNPDEWDEEYTNKQTSVPSGVFAVYYQIDEEAAEIEFAIKAATDNWVAVGMRAASIRGATPPAASTTAPTSEGEPTAEGEATSEAEPTSEGEPTPEVEGGEGTDAYGEGGEKKEDYDMEEEKKENESESESEGAAAASEGAVSEGAPVVSEGAASEGAPVASEGAPVASEGAASEGSGNGGGVCAAGNASTALRDDFVLVMEDGEVANKTNGRRLFAMPILDREVEEVVTSRRVFPGRHLAQDAADSESEAVSEAGADSEGEPSTGGTGPTLTYFGEGKCRNPLVDNPAAHPMINQDIVVGYAKGNAFRIQDSFTPSRARPLPDVYFGGVDDILDAVGKEEDGMTYLKYRRALQTDDQAGDFCIIEDTIYLMIYAYGQPEDVYTHIPNSSLETGRASNKAFYGRDELKFHGGGIGASYEGRGVFGQVDFFAAPSAAGEGGCAASSLEGYDCMQEVIPGQYVLNWRVEEDGVALAAEATAAGWVAVAWPSSPGQMVGSEAVIGWTGDGGDVIEMYDLNGKSVDAVVTTEGTFEISDSSIEEVDGKTVLRFTRKFDDAFLLEGPHDLLAAFHTDSDGLEYHSGRQGFSVSFAGGEAAEAVDQVAGGVVVSNVASDASSSADTALSGTEGSGCLLSTLEGYECMLEALPSSMNIHWAVEGDVLRLAGEATGAGYVAVGFAETPGQMVGGLAVIGWAGTGGDQVGVYALTSKADAGIVPSTDLEIFDESVEEEDGTTVVRFSTMFDDDLLPDAENPMLAAFHPDTDGIAYHGPTSKTSVALNFATGSSAVESVEDLSRYWKTHGILMTVGWGILIPLGVIVARTMKDQAPHWFYFHMVANSLGLVLATAGFALALVKFDREDNFRHRQVGISAMVLGFLQPLNAFIRPHPGTAWRDQWEWVHWTVGRVALGLAIWNIFTGLDEYEFLEEVGSKKYHVMYGLLLACLFVAYLAAEGRAQKVADRKRDKDVLQRITMLEKHAAGAGGGDKGY
eukprot:evm.model.scf_763.2 EVM.evm.TU.scf_763.2   scf_763:13070-19189(+)